MTFPRLPLPVVIVVLALLAGCGGTTDTPGAVSAAIDAAHQESALGSVDVHGRLAITWAASSEKQREWLEIADLDGSDRALVTPIPRDGQVHVSGLSWSPDGTRLAFLRSGAPAKNTALFVAGSDGGDLRRVAAGRQLGPGIGGPLEEGPVWSADSAVFAFMRDPFRPYRQKRGDLSLYVAAPDGSAVRPLRFLPRRMPALESPVVFLHVVGWSADSTTLVYQWDVYSGDYRESDWSYTELYAIGADGSQNRLVARPQSHGVALPPVGGVIPYITLDPAGVTLIDVASGDERALRTFVDEPFVFEAVTSPDGTEIYLRTESDIRAVDLASGAERQVVEASSDSQLWGLAVGGETRLIGYGQIGGAAGIRVVSPGGDEVEHFRFPRPQVPRAGRSDLGIWIR